MKSGTFTRNAVAATVVALLLLGVAMTDLGLTVYEADADRAPKVMYVPEARLIKPFLLGHEAFLADLIWIRMIGYFADELIARGRFAYLEDLINLATDLDPRFEKVYMWAGAVVMYNRGLISKEKVHMSNRILKKGWDFIQNDTRGWRHHPDYWHIPQMIGFNYAIELRDRLAGAPYIAAVARIPGSAPLYKTWAATLLGREGEWEAGSRVLEDVLAIETLRGQLEAFRPGDVKNRIRERLEEYYDRLYGEHGAERLRVLEALISRRVGEWRGSLPFVSFNLFLLLRDDADGRSLQEDTWSTLFPLTSDAL